MNENKLSMTEKVEKLWNAHKGKLAVAATVTTVVLCIAVRAQGKTYGAFLEQNGLMEKYDEFVGYVEED